MLGYPPIPARADAMGLVELGMPNVAAYDVYEGARLVGTFVVARTMTPEGRTREIHVPPLIKVHVVVRGLGEPNPAVWLHGPDVVSLEPDEETGWSRIDGEIQPGWKVLEPGRGTPVTVSDGLPAEMDVWLPRGGSVPLDVAGRRAVLRADEPTTIEIDWSALPPIPREAGNTTWSLTRESLDGLPRTAPAPARPK